MDTMPDALRPSHRQSPASHEDTARIAALRHDMPAVGQRALDLALQHTAQGGIIPPSIIMETDGKYLVTDFHAAVHDDSGRMLAAYKHAFKQLNLSSVAMVAEVYIATTDATGRRRLLDGVAIALEYDFGRNIEHYTFAVDRHDPGHPRNLHPSKTTTVDDGTLSDRFLGLLQPPDLKDLGEVAKDDVLRTATKLLRTLGPQFTYVAPQPATSARLN